MKQIVFLPNSRLLIAALAVCFAAKAPDAPAKK